MFFRAAPRVPGRGGVLTRRIWEGLMSTGLELALALTDGFGGGAGAEVSRGQGLPVNVFQATRVE